MATYVLPPDEAGASMYDETCVDEHYDAITTVGNDAHAHAVAANLSHGAAVVYQAPVAYEGVSASSTYDFVDTVPQARGRTWSKTYQGPAAASLPKATPIRPRTATAWISGHSVQQDSASEWHGGRSADTSGYPAPGKNSGASSSRAVLVCSVLALLLACAALGVAAIALTKTTSNSNKNTNDGSAAAGASTSASLVAALNTSTFIAFNTTLAATLAAQAVLNQTLHSVVASQAVLNVTLANATAAQALLTSTLSAAITAQAAQAVVMGTTAAAQTTLNTTLLNTQHAQAALNTTLANTAAAQALLVSAQSMAVVAQAALNTTLASTLAAGAVLNSTQLSVLSAQVSLNATQASVTTTQATLAASVSGTLATQTTLNATLASTLAAQSLLDGTQASARAAQSALNATLAATRVAQAQLNDTLTNWNSTLFVQWGVWNTINVLNSTLQSQQTAIVNVTAALRDGGAGGTATRVTQDTTAPCTSSYAGGLRYNTNSTLEVCNGAHWVGVPQANLGSALNPATTCNAILKSGSANGNGFYYFKPLPVQRYCNMSVSPAMSLGGDGISSETASLGCAQLAQLYPTLNTTAVRFVTASPAVATAEALTSVSVGRAFCSLSLGTGTLLSYDGSTALMSATSCAVLTNTSIFNSPSGVYWMGGVQVYCDAASGQSWGGNGATSATAGATCESIRLFTVAVSGGGPPDGIYFVGFNTVNGVIRAFCRMTVVVGVVVKVPVPAIPATLVTADGTTAAAAAASCKHLLTYFGETTSAVRWLSPAGGQPFQVPETGVYTSIPVYVCVCDVRRSQ
jgi:hypothetical protein